MTKTEKSHREDLLMICCCCGKILSETGDWIEETRGHLDSTTAGKGVCTCPDCLLENCPVCSLEIRQGRKINEENIQQSPWLAGSIGRC